MKSNSRATLLIEGHTDDRGTSEYNLALGQQRAEAVRNALTLLGVADSQLNAVSQGEERPRSTDRSEAGYAENRRADLQVQ
jgi:peptidoglycan-associated lipoprotein